jgi:lipopolysaccharide/colanic/teichoic acid biosynthesis glycosyltransferase
MADTMTFQFSTFQFDDTQLRSEGKYASQVKRLMDITIIAVTAPITLCVMAVLTIICSLDGSAPFYSQMRVGKNGRLFQCWKFRTMVPNNQKILKQYLKGNPAAKLEWIALNKLKNDPRITPIGRFLRQSSLDELPQLYNILRGDMSIVGPRPIVPDEMEKYGDSVRYYLALRPGLTGLWQTSGRNDIDYDARVGLDVTYQKSITFALDLKIILRTFGTVLSRTGF